MCPHPVLTAGFRDGDREELIHRSTPAERKTLRKLHTKASLLDAHGERAMMALVSRGVGPETAGRVLAKQPEDEDALLRELMEAEITYARTRDFWD